MKDDTRMMKAAGRPSKVTQARRKWVAEIMADGKSRKVGSFDCPAAAHFAYIIAADKLHGEFARAA